MPSTGCAGASHIGGERLERSGAMAHAILDVTGQLSGRLAELWVEENGVIAEAGYAGRLERDLPGPTTLADCRRRVLRAEQRYDRAVEVRATLARREVAAGPSAEDGPRIATPRGRGS